MLSAYDYSQRAKLLMDTQLGDLGAAGPIFPTDIPFVLYCRILFQVRRFQAGMLGESAGLTAKDTRETGTHPV